MTRGASIAVIIAMSLMCSFEGRNAATTGYFYEHPIRPYDPSTLSTLRSSGQYEPIAAGSKVVASPRPRVTVPPIPSLPPLTSLTTPRPKNTTRQSSVMTEARPKPAALVNLRPPVQGMQQQKSQPTKKTQTATKTAQFQTQSRAPLHQASSNTQFLYHRQQSLRPATSTAAKTNLAPPPRPTLKITPTAMSKPASKAPAKPLPKPTAKPTPRLPSAQSNRFPVKAAAAPAKQTPTLPQRPSVLPAPPLPKLPQRPTAPVTTSRPPAQPTVSRRLGFKKPDQVSSSRPIQASSSSGLLQSPDIYVLNGRQLKQYKVYEQIDNDIEQDLGNYIPANFFLNSFHARVGHPSPLSDDAPVQSRFGHQRSQQLLAPSPTTIALGSGGLGIVKLPDGSVYLGSGSLGYISGLQRTLDVVNARTRSGAPAPDATHFGHGPLSDSFYYGSD